MEIPKNFDLENDYIAVDFDGTLHLRPKDRSPGNLERLGEPIPEMVERVKNWLALGMQVKIFTARVSPIQKFPLESIEQQRQLIEDWCLNYIGCKLPVIYEKDCYTYQIWDDRAVCVERNTGKVLGINQPW